MLSDSNHHKTCQNFITDQYSCTSLLQVQTYTHTHQNGKQKYTKNNIAKDDWTRGCWADTGHNFKKSPNGN